MIIYNNSDVSYVYTLPDGSTAEGQSTSNTVQTENLFDAVLKVKSTSRLFARQGDTATQTIVFTNNSAAVLTDMFLTDFMSEGATYTAGTVTVNGVSHPEHDMGVGFALPDLAPSESVTVAYDVLIGAITASAKVTNDAKLNFSVMDPARGKEDFEGRTNLVTIPVVADSMSVVKSVDKNFAMRGEVLTYTSVVTNTGTLPQTSTVFRDPAPAGTTFVAGSVRVDGVSQPTYDPAAGFALRDLNAGESTTVIFEVRID